METPHYAMLTAPAADIRLGVMTAAIQADVRKIYRKSLKKKLALPATPTPNMLNVRKSEGGDLPDKSDLSSLNS